MSTSVELRSFHYTSKDLSVVIRENIPHDDHQNKSSIFDNLLTSQWETAMSNGLFRYQLSKDCLPFKVLPGRFSYVAQLNPDRAQKRRKPQEIQSVNQPFNPAEFNFNKIQPVEILAKLEPSWSNKADEHLLLINVSPLEYCHVLLTPSRNQCNPQKITRNSLRLALELCLLSNSPDFRVGFNSLCGFASVNHEHYHAYYLSKRLYVEHAQLESITPSYFQFKDEAFPPGFCIVLTIANDEGIDSAVCAVLKLTEYFQSHDVGHNLYITRGSTISTEGHFDSIRVFVWARKSSFGSKECDAFNPALCELAGHFPIKSQGSYETLTEEYILTELHEICDEPFSNIKCLIVSGSI